MRVLVIGGTAFTGPHIVRRLHALGHDVAIFNRGKTEADLPAEVIRFTGDCREIEKHAEVLRGFAPEVALHMALVIPQDAWSALEVFRGVARRLVAISSMDVYRAYGRLIGTEPGPLLDVPIREDAPLRLKFYPYREKVPGPDNLMFHYDKVLIERLLQSEPGLPATIVRYPMVYGPGDRQHRLFSYLKRMDDGRPAILLSEEMANWRCNRGFAEDMAHAVVLAVTNERAAGRTYNVAEAGAGSERQWIERIARGAGWNGRVVAIANDRLPEKLRDDMNTAQSLVADTTAIRSELGYAEVVDPGEAMRRTIEWERSHPPEPANPEAFDYAAEDEVLGGEGQLS